MRPTHCLLLTLTLVLSAATPAWALAPSIVIDGSQLPSDVPALLDSGHVFVPLRDVFERLGATVSFDDQSQTAQASRGNSVVQVTVGSLSASVDGQRTALDVAPREVAGRVMIPLRFVAQALGATVDYDDASDTVVIVSGLPPGNFAAMTSGPGLAPAPKLAPDIEDARPASGSLTGSEFPTIYAHFKASSSAVDPSSVRVLVDGADVTGSSTISSAYVSYTPASPLLTGEHSVSITGASDDGTTFSSGWTFRVDAGTASDYTAQTYGSGSGGYYGGYGYGGYRGGLDAFGWPARGFGRFGFFPPGFSVFTPGPLFFVSGGVIEVFFVSRFFPVGSAFFTISGFPGTFPLTPWLGNPGFFWGCAQVPFGMTAHSALIAARFETLGGRKFIVRSTAPLEIEGQRRSLPSDLRYAVLPHLVNHPHSLQHAVTFERIVPAGRDSTGPVVGANVHNVRWSNDRPEPVNAHAAPGVARTEPARMHPPESVHPVPVAEHPVIHPVIRPPQIERPGLMPIERSPLMQWQFQQPAHPAGPAHS